MCNALFSQQETQPGRECVCYWHLMEMRRLSQYLLYSNLRCWVKRKTHGEARKQITAAYLVPGRFELNKPTRRNIHAVDICVLFSETRRVGRGRSSFSGSASSNRTRETRAGSASLCTRLVGQTLNNICGSSWLSYRVVSCGRIYVPPINNKHRISELRTVSRATSTIATAGLFSVPSSVRWA